MRYAALVIALFFSLTALSQEDKSLNGSWEFRRAGTRFWQPATVPGHVHTDLLALDSIADPWLNDNELTVQWVDSVDWEYRHFFSLNSSEANHPRAVLQFDGIDTEAEIWLNGFRLFAASNMFRRYELTVSGKLKPGKNQLEVRFKSALKSGAEKAAAFGLRLPGGESAFVRKAAYQFGWDWAPRLIGCGIWKPITLRFEPIARFSSNVSFDYPVLNDSLAIVRVKGVLSGELEDGLDVEAAIYSRGSWIRQTITLNGADQFSMPMVIENPERWYPNGYGKQPVYPVRMRLLKDGKILNERTYRIGLRTVQWVQQKDTTGSGFGVWVNDKPIFIKGANWVPADAFPARVPDSLYLSWVAKAHKANLNMLRVWGGGIYADEAFLDACDSLGILVWHDFMFANTPYPAETAFIDNVRDELVQQIERMRHRPSIALWCGNNEITEGFYNWGWPKQYGWTAADSSRLHQMNNGLFENQIAYLVKQLDPQRYYHPSSPSNGWGKAKAYTEGDVHYWGVWWGFEPFENYSTKVGRFVSEYGFQAYPSAEVLTKYIPDWEFPASWGLKKHQKHPTGDSTINHYVLRYFHAPGSKEDLREISQLNQAYGMQQAMEAHRFSQPYCMGSLFWQWNDSWPAISWSVLDIAGMPKAAYYQVKRSFAPQAIQIKEDAKKLNVWLLSDTLLKNKLQLKVSIYRFDGRLVLDTTLSTNQPKELKQLLVGLELPKIIGARDTNWIAQAILLADKQELSRNWYFRGSPARLPLQAVQVTYQEEEGSWNMKVNKPTLYFRTIPSRGEHLEFIHLMPGEKIPIGEPAEIKEIKHYNATRRYDNYLRN